MKNLSCVIVHISNASNFLFIKTHEQAGSHGGSFGAVISKIFCAPTNFVVPKKIFLNI